MSLSRKVAYNFSFQIASKIINTLIGIVNVALITRYLGVSGYGDYTTAFAYIAFFSIISDFGFFWIIVRRIAAGEDESLIVKNATTTRLIFASIVFLSALVLLQFLPYSPQLRLAIILVAFSILWSSQTSVYNALFQAKLKMDLASTAETISKVMALGLIWLSIRLDLDIIYVIGSSLIGTFFNYIFCFSFSLRFIKPAFGLDKKFMHLFFLEALPIGIASILSLIYFKIDTVILSLYKTSVDVGIYGTPYKILEILTAIPVMFVGSVFPALTVAFANNDHQKLKNLFQKSFDLLSIGAFAVISITVALARPITNLIAGEQYLNTSTVSLFALPISSDMVLQILIFAVGFSFLNALFTNAVVVFGKQKSLIIPYLVGTVFNLSANILLIPKFSYLAAAVTTVVTEFIILIYCQSIVRKNLPVGLELGKFFKSFVVAAVVFIVLMAVKNFSIFITLPLGIILFPSGLILLGIINKDAVKGLLKN